MTKQEKITAETPAQKVVAPTGLALLREPFPANQISKLPKPTKTQNEDVKADFRKGIRCKICGGWHHPEAAHLDYVGHAALTDRLLDCDPEWNWEPVSKDEHGAPILDANGGMWIRLTVCGLTRLGYGDADGKRGGNAVKEVIGDALRNAAMRFGAALDLWHKGDLHGLEDDAEKDDPVTEKGEPEQEVPPPPTGDRIKEAIAALNAAPDIDALKSAWTAARDVQSNPAVVKAKEDRKAALEKPADDGSVALDDEIPY